MNEDHEHTHQQRKQRDLALALLHGVASFAFFFILSQKMPPRKGNGLVKPILS